jgi:hypothetical protein
LMVKIVELKILLSNREIVKTKIKIVIYFLVCVELTIFESNQMYVSLKVHVAN